MSRHGGGFGMHVERSARGVTSADGELVATIITSPLLRTLYGVGF